MPNISIPLAFDTKNSGLHRFPCLEPNVEFSRHAARKPMIARYRQMPRGRPGMPSWSLSATQLLRHRFWAAELLTCGLQQLRYCKPETNFGLRSHNRTICESATDFGLRGHNRTIANLRKILIRMLYRANKPPQVRRNLGRNLAKPGTRRNFKESPATNPITQHAL